MEIHHTQNSTLERPQTQSTDLPSQEGTVQEHSQLLERPHLYDELHSNTVGAFLTIRHIVL